MTKPLELTSPNHATALTLDLGMAVFGGAFLLGALDSKGIPLMVGVVLYPVWAFLMVLSGLAAATSAFIAPKSSKPRVCLTVEAWASAALALTLLVYGVSTLWVPQHTYITLTLFTVLGLGIGSRTLQITRELFKLRLAEEAPVIVVLRESLADPIDDV